MTTPENTVSVETPAASVITVKWTDRRVPYIVVDGKAKFISLADAAKAGAVRPEPAPKPVVEKAPTAKAVSPFIVASSEAHRLMGKLALEAAAASGDEQAAAELSRRAHNKGLKAAPVSAPAVESKPTAAPASASAPAAVKAPAADRAAFIRAGLASKLLSESEALALLLG